MAVVQNGLPLKDCTISKEMNAQTMSQTCIGYNKLFAVPAACCPGP